MPRRDRTWRFSASPAGFAQASADVRAALDEGGVHGRARHNIELIFEEVVSNVIRHAYDDAGAHEIDVSLGYDSDAIVLTVDDDGRPFNPLERPDPELPTSLEDAPLGGLGILLVRKASTNVRYERTEDHRNRLTVTIAST